MIVPDKRNSANKKKLGRSNPPRASPKKTRKNKGRNDILHNLTGNIAADMKRLLMEPADWFKRLDKKKWFLMNVPYILIGCAADKVVWLYRNSTDITALDKVLDTLNHLDCMFGMPIVSIHYQDILYGIAGGVWVKVIVYYRTKNAKKYRKGGEAVSSLNGNFRENWSVPVEEGKPYPDVLIHFRYAAYLAGLGEIGWSGVFLTPEFGPRVRFNLILTDAELEADPLVEPGTICDRCKQCVRNCGGAISETETVKVTLGGKQIEYALLDPLKCEYGLKNGCDNTANPFLVEYPHVYGYGRAVEGGRGCVRACMVHLEKRHKLKNEFHNPFRQKPLWKVDKNADHPYPEWCHKPNSNIEGGPNGDRFKVCVK